MRTIQLRGLRAALVALSLTAAGVAGAQPAQPVQKDPAQPPAGGPGGGRGGRGMQALFEGITLTDAQKKSIDSIQTAFQAKREAAAPEDRRALMQQQRDAVRGLLTEEQKKTYDANFEKMRANMQRPNGR